MKRNRKDCKYYKEYKRGAAWCKCKIQESTMLCYGVCKYFKPIKEKV